MHSAGHHHRRSRMPAVGLLSQAVPMLSRHELAALTERLIEALDSEVDERRFDLALQPRVRRRRRPPEVRHT